MNLDQGLNERRENQSNRILKEINSLRLVRQVFNAEIARRETQLFHRLGDLRNIDLDSGDEDDPPIIPSYNDFESDDDTLPDLEPLLQATSVVKIEPSTIYTPVDNNSDLRIGDCVRIKNGISHVSGPVTESDRLAILHQPKD